MHAVMRILAILSVLLLWITATAQSETDMLAFVGTTDDNGYALFLINADGENLTELYTCDAICRDPVWSADGAHLGLVDGQTLVIITAATGNIENSLSVDMGTYDYNARPSWTADLSRVVYAARVDMVNRLRIADLATGDITTLDDIAGGATGPQWTPDADAIIYASGGRIYELDIDSGTVNALTPADSRYDFPALATADNQLVARALNDQTGLDHITEPTERLYSGIIDAPVWSPDGEKIALITWDDGEVSLVVIPIDTPDNAIILADNAVLNYRPTWTPDGSTIAYTGIDPDQPQFLALFTVPADGSAEPALIMSQMRRAAGTPSSPAWQP